MAFKLDKQTITEHVVTIVALIFSLAYAIYCGIFWGGAIANGDPYAPLAAYILMPHFVATGVGIVLTCLALFLNVSWWNLAAGVVYLIGIACFPAYWFFLIVPAVLSFVAFYRMRKYEKAIKPLEDAEVESSLDAQSEDAPNEQMAEEADKADKHVA